MRPWLLSFPVGSPACGAAGPAGVEKLSLGFTVSAVLFSECPLQHGHWEAKKGRSCPPLMRTAHLTGRPQATIRSIHSCRERKGKRAGQVSEYLQNQTQNRGSARPHPNTQRKAKTSVPRAGRQHRLPRRAAADDRPEAWSDESLVYEVFICSCKVIFYPTS